MGGVTGDLDLLRSRVGKQGADADLCSRNADAAILEKGALLERCRSLFIDTDEARVMKMRFSNSEDALVVTAMARVTLYAIELYQV